MSKKLSDRKRLVAAPAVAPLRRRQGRRAAVPLATSAAAAPMPGTCLGKLVGVGAQGEPWIDLPGQGLARVLARATTPIHPAMIGRQVVVTFLDGQTDQPVVLGVMRAPGETADAGAPALDAIVDGERIVLTGRREIVLRCGKASIALAADGRVVIKGANLLATAAGTHRIRGGVVQIN